MAYGVDIPTEVGYIYKKTTGPGGDKSSPKDENKTVGIPNLETVFVEEPGGDLTVESYDATRGSIAEHFIKKKTKKQPYEKKIFLILKA